MLTSGILVSILAATGTTASPILSTRQDRTSTGISVIDARWDGSCYYPVADDDFDLEDYLGRWYQIAGTVTPFTDGCSCIYADYSRNDNGTVNVSNGCQRDDQSVTIQGTATPVDEAYGDEGVFQVQFPGQPASECPGPNYIVQDFNDDGGDDDNDDDDDDDDDDNDDNDDNIDDDESGFAIVQASNFSTLFLLSRRQVVEDSVIDRWLRRAERLGTNLTDVVKTDQTGCMFTK